MKRGLRTARAALALIVFAAASMQARIISGAVPMMPAQRVPSAVATAAVSVAKSIMKSGLRVAAYDRASASTRRPSAAATLASRLRTSAATSARLTNDRIHDPRS